jgi:hypothetical protein
LESVKSVVGDNVLVGAEVSVCIVANMGLSCSSWLL